MKSSKLCKSTWDFNIRGKYCNKMDILLVNKSLYPISTENMDSIFSNRYIYIDARSNNLYLLDKLICRVKYSSFILNDQINLDIALKRRLHNTTRSIDFSMAYINNFFIYKDLLCNRSPHYHTYNNLRYLYTPFDSNKKWAWGGLHPFFGQWSLDKYDTSCTIIEKIQDFLWGSRCWYYTHCVNYQSMFPQKDYSKMYTHTYSVYNNLHDLKKSEVIYSYHFFYTDADFSKYFDNKDFLIKNIHNKYYKLNYSGFFVD